MATKTATNPKTIIEMPDVIAFRQLLDAIVVKGKDSAVFARHFVQDMDAASKRLKDVADNVLYSQKDNAKVIATDTAGNTWAVLFQQVNEKQYDETDEMTAAIEAVEAAKKHLSEVQERTTFKMVRKGEKGYSYKVTKP